MIIGICYNMVICDRADGSNPRGLMEYAGHEVGRRRSIYHVGTDKGPLVIATVFRYV